MEPTLPNGGVNMAESTSTDWNPPCFEVVQLGDDTFLRRIASDDEGLRRMVCDHPDWLDEP